MAEVWRGEADSKREVGGGAREGGGGGIFSRQESGESSVLTRQKHSLRRRNSRSPEVCVASS
jgi:hypothetical protein